MAVTDFISSGECMSGAEGNAKCQLSTMPKDTPADPDGNAIAEKTKKSFTARRSLLGEASADDASSDSSASSAVSVLDDNARVHGGDNNPPGRIIPLYLVLFVPPPPPRPS